MSHLKRQGVPKNWPIARKGTAYVVKPYSHFSDSVPVLVALRDMIKVAQNRKEVKAALHKRTVLLNTKQVLDDKVSINLFDVLTLVPSKKSYRLTLDERGKFMFEEIKESESGKKVAKVVDKKMLKGKKIQLNLSGGINLISNTKCNINDSLLVNLKEKKIEECVPLKENAKVLIFAGKHAGEKGKVTKIDAEKKMVELEVGGKQVNVLIKQLIVTQ